MRPFRFRVLPLAVILCGQAALAVDGVVLIDQNRALAGNVTPGDAPGFPVTLSQSGSYRLSSNLTLPGDVTAIFVTANGVTIDLNGFSIIGPGSGSSAGITTPSSAGAIFTHDTTVLNGTVRGMGYGGIWLGDMSRVEGVRLISNGQFGISVGRASVVRNNIVYGHSSFGIGAVFSSIVGNTSHNNNVSFFYPESTRDQNSPAP